MFTGFSDKPPKPALIDYSPLLCGLYIWLRMKLGLTPPGFSTWLREQIGSKTRRSDAPSCVPRVKAP